MPRALVTGASRGIGHGIADALAAQGWDLFIAGRDAERLDATRAEMLAAGAGSVVTVVGDAAKDADVATLVALAGAEPLDALVMSAGVGTAGRIAEVPVHRADKTFAVDYRAPFLLIQGLLPALRAAAVARPAVGAKIVALASITGVMPEPGLAAYGAAKAALISLIAGVNAEEAVNGVTATAISPGYVDTEMSSWVHDSVPADTMIPVSDIVELVDTLLRMSPRTVAAHIVLSRAGSPGARA